MKKTLPRVKRKPYRELLRDPRWQQKRLKLLDSAEWKCKSCGNGRIELQIHHLRYLKDYDPWMYPDSDYEVLCKECHEWREAFNKLFGRLETLSTAECRRRIAAVPLGSISIEVETLSEHHGIAVLVSHNFRNLDPLKSLCRAASKAHRNKQWDALCQKHPRLAGLK